LNFYLRVFHKKISNYLKALNLHFERFRQGIEKVIGNRRTAGLEQDHWNIQ